MHIDRVDIGPLRLPLREISTCFVLLGMVAGYCFAMVGWYLGFGKLLRGRYGKFNLEKEDSIVNG